MTGRALVRANRWRREVPAVVVELDPDIGVGLRCSYSG
jgi:hypothetical protein